VGELYAISDMEHLYKCEQETKPEISTRDFTVSSSSRAAIQIEAECNPEVVKRKTVEQRTSNHFEFLNVMMPRYFRYVAAPENPTQPEKQRCAQHQAAVAEGSIQVHRPFPLAVKWLPGFYCIPGYVPMSHVGGLEDGIYPMDASSGLVVHVLMQKANDTDKISTVLDLCCSPGSKLQMIFDRLASETETETETELSDPTGQYKGKPLVVGVDVSERRLDLCRALLRKSLQSAAGLRQRDSFPASSSSSSHSDSSTGKRLLLFQGDGVQFDMCRKEGSRLVFDSYVIQQEIANAYQCGASGCKSVRKKINKSARAREKKNLARETLQCSNCSLFDRVLVDAECTHSGSYRHMRHATVPEHGINAMKPRATERYHKDARRDALSELQRQLILNGFRQLKAGSGRMVYSTCSDDVEQNERVVQWLLDTEPSCEVITSLYDIFEGGNRCPASHNSKLEIDSTKATDTLQQTTPASRPEVLTMTDAELEAFLLNQSPDDLRCMSLNVCRFAAEQIKFPVEEGSIPGSFMLSRRGGTSGMFFSVLRKKET